MPFVYTIAVALAALFLAGWGVGYHLLATWADVVLLACGLLIGYVVGFRRGWRMAGRLP